MPRRPIQDGSRPFADITNQPGKTVRILYTDSRSGLGANGSSRPNEVIRRQIFLVRILHKRCGDYLKFDPSYRKIAKRFQENPEEFKLAFAKAWFKLTHREMGPRARYVGTEIPDEVLLWQDPVPAVDHDLIDAEDIAKLKSDVIASGLTIPELVRTAWASASSFRGTDMRGGDRESYRMPRPLPPGGAAAADATSDSGQQPPQRACAPERAR